MGVDRELVLVNQAFERLLGCSREDVLGRPARMLCRLLRLSEDPPGIPKG